VNILLEKISTCIKNPKWDIFKKFTFCISPNSYELDDRVDPVLHVITKISDSEICKTLEEPILFTQLVEIFKKDYGLNFDAAAFDNHELSESDFKSNKNNYQYIVTLGFDKLLPLYKIQEPYYLGISSQGYISNEDIYIAFPHRTFPKIIRKFYLINKRSIVDGKIKQKRS